MKKFDINDINRVLQNITAKLHWQKICNQVRDLHQKNQWIIPGIGVGIILVVILFMSYMSHSQNNTLNKQWVAQEKRAALVLKELEDMNEQLQHLSSNPQNSDAFKTALTTITADLTAIEKSLSDSVKIKDMQKISSQISGMKEDVDAQMLDIKREVAGKTASKSYLDAKVLPFHVISIDVIAQQPFVSIDYAHHITPFMVGDTVAGWTVAFADYNAATVEFKNSDDHYVKVSLQG